MDNLPDELLHLIISFLPKSSLSQVRLVSHKFDTLAFPLLFAHVEHWLDFKRSHTSITSLAHDYCNRPAVMWSPWASEPEGEIDDVWLHLAWRVLVKTPPLGDKGEGLTARNFAELSGKEDMTEKLLRTGQNRFLLFRSYAEEAKGDIFKTVSVDVEGGDNEDGCDFGFER